MSCDKLVFDLSQEVEGSPNVFIRKDWLNILDNQNTNYQNNQSIIDTSQLANSNKYMGYREGYLAVPMLLTAVGPLATGGAMDFGDFSIGLKNWFGQIIHSFTLDYNGTTIVQQTPFCQMWNSFKLMTSLSWGDVITQGPTIGFYPDKSGAWSAQTVDSSHGVDVCNSDLAVYDSIISGYVVNSYDQLGSLYCTPAGAEEVYSILGGNSGLSRRTKWIAFDATAGGLSGATIVGYGSPGLSSSAYGTIGVKFTDLTQIWKSNIVKKTTGTVAVRPSIQIAVMATIYLKHIHSFFNMCPLLKGVFMKMTMNLNNASSTITIDNTTKLISGWSSSVPVGGVNPLMVPSIDTGLSSLVKDGDYPVLLDSSLYYNLSIGYQCLDQTITSLAGVVLTTGNLSKSIYLYLPAYTFNPTFEQAYLSSNIKSIKYTDIYQYQVTSGIVSGQQFNQLITNGIANIKSVLIIPFFKKSLKTGTDYVEYQSPFDPAGCGPTAPMVALGNFNVQISGQNAIYNMQRYSFEEWNNQLYGQFAVNGGLTDGLTSGLIGFDDFQNSYCYYYVNVERMLPVEQSVPKSVQILGTNYSTQELNLWVFIEYGVQVSIDVLTGARV
jgi:hypothetical protein